MIADWIYEWGPPKGGTIFSGFDGMGTVVMAAMSLENFNVFAFEKDERIWKAAIDEVTNFGELGPKDGQVYQTDQKLRQGATFGLSSYDSACINYRR